MHLVVARRVHVLLIVKYCIGGHCIHLGIYGLPSLKSAACVLSDMLLQYDPPCSLRVLAHKRAVAYVHSKRLCAGLLLSEMLCRVHSKGALHRGCLV